MEFQRDRESKMVVKKVPVEKKTEMVKKPTRNQKKITKDTKECIRNHITSKLGYA